jgi:C-terminal processing protease CtpA/Prc
MAFRATPHSTLLGSQTAGADGNTTPITLPGGLKTLMTGIGAYYPDERETQRVGLAIDVRVRPTVAGLRAGRDELCDRAVELITNAPKPGH